MNKKEIADVMFEKLNVKKYEAYSFVDLLIETLTENLLKGEKIVLSNFGTLKVVERKAKRVRNPNSKEMMTIEPRKIVTFLPSKNLKHNIRT